MEKVLTILITIACVIRLLFNLERLIVIGCSLFIIWHFVIPLFYLVG